MKRELEPNNGVCKTVSVNKLSFNKILDYIGVTFLAANFLLVAAQVIMRYIFSEPLIWSEELARQTLVWGAFIGAVLAMRDNEHVEVSVLVNILPDKIKKYVEIVSKLISAIFLIVLIYYGFKMVFNNLSTVSMVTGINMWIVFSIIPICAIGMLAFLIKNMREV